MGDPGRKAKDDIIGGKDFSRVRRFDDEARKARIFRQNAGIAVEVNQIEEQLREKEQKRQIEEMERRAEETRIELERENWNRADEELKKKRIKDRSALEAFWAKQHAEFKEKWKHRVNELNPDKVGLLPAERYRFQDEEVVRESQVVNRITQAWRHQINEHNDRLRREMEEKQKNDHEMEQAMKNWERKQEEITRKIFQSNVELANDYLRQYREKMSREKQIHDEEHFYQISKEFFEQFGTTSR